MALDSTIQGGSNTAGKANVDPTFNLQVNLPLSDATAGYAVLLAESDTGTVTGARMSHTLEVTEDYRLRVGQDNMLMAETFSGAAINTAIWNNPTSVMTTTVSAGFANLNAGLSVASGAVDQLRTYRHFPAYKTFTLYAEAEVQFVQPPQSNNVCEWGLFLAAGTAAPTDGAFFRLTSTGEFRCIINFNGVETQSAAFNFNTIIGTNLTRQFLIYLGSTAAHFWVDNVLLVDMKAPDGQASITSSMNLPLTFRNYNAAATTLAQVMKVGNTNVSVGDQSMAKAWPHVISGGGGSSAQGQTGGTMGSTALYSNNLAAGVGAAMTNTSAALGAGLGGQFSALPTLVVGTDGIISSFQVPLGTAAQPGKTLYITSIDIQSMVTTVLAGGPLLYAYSLAFGSTNVSLATVESAIAKAPRRVPLGFENIVAAAALGATGPKIALKFDTPIVVQPGEFVQSVAKNLGTVTTTGVVTWLVSINGYYE